MYILHNLGGLIQVVPYNDHIWDHHLWNWGVICGIFLDIWSIISCYLPLCYSNHDPGLFLFNYMLLDFIITNVLLFIFLCVYFYIFYYFWWMFMLFIYNFIYYLWRVPAQDIPFFYTTFHLSELKSCKSIISTNFTFIFVIKWWTKQLSHWIVSCTKSILIFVYGL